MKSEEGEGVYDKKRIITFYLISHNYIGTGRKEKKGEKGSCCLFQVIILPEYQLWPNYVFISYRALVLQVVMILLFIVLWSVYSQLLVFT